MCALLSFASTSVYRRDGNISHWLILLLTSRQNSVQYVEMPRGRVHDTLGSQEAG